MNVLVDDDEAVWRDLKIKAIEWERVGGVQQENW